MLVITLILLLGLIALSVPIAAALGVLGLIMDQQFSMLPLTKAIGEISWSTSNDFLLMAIPLFILLGEILLRAGFADKMYNAMSLWLSWLPGGLMHANIGASALFSATCGSSVATAATVGTVAVPQLHKFGYNKSLFLGSIAAGGTLGILIPPSINLILYGVLTNTSVPKLYLAAFVPGMLLALLFVIIIALVCAAKPSFGGHRVEASWKARIASLVDLLPPLGLFMLVVGSIYLGIATATEASALGVLGSLFMAHSSKRLSWAMLTDALEGTMRSTVMVVLIVIAAAFLSFVMSSTGLTVTITDFIVGLHLSPELMLLIIVVFYLILGCVMETLSMMITTIPIIAPIMVAMGFDPVWLGIVIIILVEAALITPPVGINLFVVHSVSGGGTLSPIIKGSLPFVVAMLLLVLLLAVFPDIALWLPSVFNG
ncbi:TRAP transporter large permease [Castellaniella sp.]|uniref:TRAP transporter large permease n=1 Tax=Castellaniella sp. TaxID=1955812 RepID=UPI003C748D6B